jgi:hypothetical protein
MTENLPGSAARADGRKVESCGMTVSHHEHAWPLVGGVMSTRWCIGIAPTCWRCRATLPTHEEGCRNA